VRRRAGSDAEVARRFEEEQEAPARASLVALPAPALLPPFGTTRAQLSALSTFHSQRHAAYALLVHMVAEQGWDEFLEVRSRFHSTPSLARTQHPRGGG
jgi:hypothetical protein